MPRVHYVKKARKDNPAVKAGEPYYWWKFRYGGKRYSRTRPTRSQLTQSDKLARIYSCEDSIWAISTPDIESYDGDHSTIRERIAQDLELAAATIEQCAEEFREVGEEYNESAENVEEHFPGSPQVDDIREKADACEGAAEECDEAAQAFNDAATEIRDMDVSDPDEDWKSEVEEWLDGLPDLNAITAEV